MSTRDSDPLHRAAALLREGRTGHNPGSGFTRARILNDLRTQRKKRNRWWRLGFPFGIVLAGTTAWASAEGRLPQVWETVSHYLSLPLTGNGVSETVHSKPSSKGPVAGAISTTTPEPAPVGNELEPAGPSELAEAPPLEEGLGGAQAASGQRPPSERTVMATSERAPSSRRSTPPATKSSRDSDLAPSPSASEHREVVPPTLDAEISEFRRANDLFLKHHDHAAAVSAYRRYLKQYPQGRFVPEARYNTALSLIRLGRVSEARALLEPFADGSYGAYRKAAARRLLEALHE